MDHATLAGPPCCRVVRRSCKSRAIEPVVRMGCTGGAIEPGVQMGSSRAIEPVLRMGSSLVIEPGVFSAPPPFSPFSPGLCQEWWSLPPSIGSGPAARCVWCLGSARSVGVALQLLPLRGKEVWHRKTGGAPRAPPRLSRACAPGRGLGFCPLSVRQARSRFGVVTTTPRTASAAPPIGKSLY